MQQTGLLSTLVTFIIVMVLLIAEVFIARYLEKGRKSVTPNQLPYTWGFFFGIQGVVFAFLLVTGVLLSPDGDKSSLVITGTFAILIWGLPGYYVIQRRRWAWTTLTIVSFNPFIWIINYYYGKNRRNEFSQSSYL